MFTLGLLITVVILALAFDYVNGFHDTANAIATSVSTKALSPRAAILIAASLNFVGALTGTEVAKTIGKGIVDPGLVTAKVLIFALIAAIAWNLITWYFGIPSSSSHAIIGGLTGAAFAAFGSGSIEWNGFIKILGSLVLTPVIALAVGSACMTLLFWLFRRYPPSRINHNFRRLQIVSACMMAFSHGSNDAQKSMGIITMALLASASSLDRVPFLKIPPSAGFDVPTWVMIACALAMGAGTMAGGWKIIRTMGGKIVKIEPINGFASDFSSSLVIYTASHFGLPVSTTHVVSSAIMGVGAAKRLKAVRWGVAQRIVTAWIVTIPTSGLIAALTYKIFGNLF